MTDNTIGVGFSHINLAGLFSGGYLQALDAPVDSVTVGVPPIQRQMRIRVGEVDRAVGLIYISHQNRLEFPDFTQLPGFAAKLEFLKGIRASEIIYSFAGFGVESAGVLAQRK